MTAPFMLRLALATKIGVGIVVALVALTVTTLLDRTDGLTGSLASREASP